MVPRGTWVKVFRGLGAPDQTLPDLVHLVRPGSNIPYCQTIFILLWRPLGAWRSLLVVGPWSVVLRNYLRIHNLLNLRYHSKAQASLRSAR